MAAASILPLTQRPTFDRIFPSAERPVRFKCRQLHVCRLEKLSPDGAVGFDPVTSECTIPHPVKSRRRFVELGCGLLAATMTMTMAAEAEEEKKDEESCELTFAPSGLGYCDMVVGTGIEPPQGELIMIHYTGRFVDGTVFDSSYKRARALILRIGVGKVIPGWDLGILGGDGVPPMLAGGKRKLRIPPELAYGQYPVGCYAGKCNIPGNSTLLYDMMFIGLYK